MSRVEAEFGVRLTVADLFADPTIGGLASLLRAAGVSDGDVSSDGEYALVTRGGPLCVLLMMMLLLRRHRCLELLAGLIVV